jgi:hypothetical protein
MRSTRILALREMDELDSRLRGNDENMSIFKQAF